MVAPKKMNLRPNLSVMMLMVAILISCSSGSSGSKSGGVAPKPTQKTAFVTTTDFTTGSYSTINLEDFSAAVNLPAQTGIIESDNDAVFFNDKIYVINRFGFDNITLLDTADLTTAIHQFSTGNGTNPQDMAFVSDTKAYVSLLGANDILIVDPTDVGNEIKSRIDLSGFLDPADTDGLVEAGAMVMVRNFLFVVLQRLVNFSSELDGFIVVIDTQSDTLVDVDPTTPGVIDPIVLTGRNPVFMEFEPSLGKIVVSEAGSFFDQTDGGVETVNTSTFQAEGFIVDESELGGDVGDVVLVNGTKGYVVIGGFGDNGVAVFDVGSGTKLGELAVSAAFIPSLALDGRNRLLVADRTLTNPGIRIYDTQTDTEIQSGLISVGLPPNNILIIQPPQTAFTTTTDFTTGSYSTINLEDFSAAVNLPAQTGIIESDNNAVFFNEKIYVINRFGFDNITLLDTADLTTAIHQFSTGNGTNPQDMAFVSDTKAYVSLLGANDILVVDPTDVGNEIKSRIDLSGFLDPADTDGLLEAGAMVLVRNYLFVALQRLVNFSSDLEAFIVVIDTQSETLVDVDPATPGVIDPIVLTGRNPVFMEFEPSLGKIVVSEAGSFFDQTDGGVETVDPSTFQAEGFIIDEGELGGDVGDVALVNGTKGYVVIGGFADNGVAIFDVDSGTKLGELAVSASFIPSLALDGRNRLLVADRTLTNPGIRIYDTQTDIEVTTGPIDVGLPPNSILIY
jgi:type IV secretory pathway component VirB8